MPVEVRAGFCVLLCDVGYHSARRDRDRDLGVGPASEVTLTAGEGQASHLIRRELRVRPNGLWRRRLLPFSPLADPQSGFHQNSNVDQASGTETSVQKNRVRLSVSSS